MAWLLVTLYLMVSIGLLAYALNSYVMVFLFLKGRKKASAFRRDVLASFDAGVADLPLVTTQIPLYNEYNVAERVIRAVSSMSWPRDRHQIQVLDDSDDETGKLVEACVSRLAEQGIRIKVLRRNCREGFKAGALRHGLERASGGFVAVFDADFVPPSDFLLKTVPFFLRNPKLGLVQARWGHLNAASSMLTRAQSLGIDGHFMVEQAARNFSGLFMNFNGTAGIFRKTAIIDAGGWHSDTLTEDMDLSYRMQLVGWEALYIPDLVVPGEIPEDVRAFRNQQFRWAKGSIETALKLLPDLFRSNSSWRVKIQAFFHMTHYMIHPLMLAAAVLALPVMHLVRGGMGPCVFFSLALVLLLSMSAPSVLYLTAGAADGKPFRRTLSMIPGLMIIGTGIALSNSRAVIEALLGHRTEFVRTPKRGEKTRKSYGVGFPVLAVFEMAMGVYCLFSFLSYLERGLYLVGPFLAVYSAGFLLISFQTFLQIPGRGGP